MRTDTEYRSAFEAVARAARGARRFRMSHDRKPLKPILEKLRSAAELDRNYLLVPYYMAIIEDLLGNSKQAIEILTELRDQLPEKDCLRPEIEFNLSVAYYHSFQHVNLTTSADVLNDLLVKSKNSVLPKDIHVSQYSEALLAKVYAVNMVPNDVDCFWDHPEEEVRIRDLYDLALATADRLLSPAPWYKPGLLKLPPDEKALAIARNARALARMYFADFLAPICKSAVCSTRRSSISTPIA
jgi:hypothetical protein